MAGLFHKNKRPMSPYDQGAGRTALWKVMLLTAVIIGLAGPAQAIENTASGSVGGSVLDTSSATVTLNLLSSTVDPGNSTVTVNPATLPADGTSVSTITVVLRDAANLPIPGRTVTISSNRGGLDTISQPAAPTDASGTATGTISSLTAGVSTITVTDVLDTVVLNDQPQVVFSQGMVLDLTKRANKEREVVGGIITYSLQIRNLTSSDVGQVRIEDLIPPNFKYVRGSARLDGAALTDPTGNRPMTFDIGTVPAFADSNGNGEADPGEPGYMELSYQLIIGSGARPGEYTNTAVAWDATPLSAISNASDARVTVIMDPLFDLGTIIGKVFEDRDQDGWQDKGEEGIQGAVVVLDDGTYVTTDEFGRYHIPAIKPGHRLVKIDQRSLPAGTVVTGEISRIVSVTPGLW